MKRYLAGLIIMFVGNVAFSKELFRSTLCFNELMISNIEGYMFEYDFPNSWVEIYNTSDKDINLKDYRITTNKFFEGYKVKDTLWVASKGYCLLFSSLLSKDIASDEFNLNSAGGSLYFYDPENTLIDSLIYPAMIEPQIGYGKISNSNYEWQWERMSTPGKANSGVFTNKLSPKPIFSTSGKSLTGPIDVKISVPEENRKEFTRVYYTIDGSEPDDNSNFFVYDSIFHIDNSTVIRAKIISDSTLLSRSTTESFIIHPRNTDLPIISLATNNSWFYDDTLGIFSDKKVFNNTSNYEQKWRRPVNIEYFDSFDEESVFNQLVETGVFGASSRQMPQKALKLIANKRFGKKYIDGAFWSIKPCLKVNKSILLRSGGNLGNLVRISDGFIQNLFGTHTDIDYMAYTPIIAYINGQYAGVYGLRERSNEDNIWGNYDGLENIEIKTNTSNSSSPHYSKFMSIVESKNVSYNDIDNYLDVDEFCNELCLQIFAANMDWPYNNVFLWRKNDDKSKWRFVTKDVDMIGTNWRTSDANNLNYYKYLTVNTDDALVAKLFKENSFLKKNAESSTSVFAIFQAILSNDQFSNVLVDKLMVYLGDFLKPSITKGVLEHMRDEISGELMYTRKKYYNDFSNDVFFDNINKLISFLTQRPKKVYKLTSEFYHLGYVIPMTTRSNGMNVSINKIKLTEGDFDGACFLNKELCLDSGDDNFGWKISIHKSDNTVVNKQIDNRSICLKMSDYLVNDTDSIICVNFETNQFKDCLPTEFEERIASIIDSSSVVNYSKFKDVEFPEPSIAYVNFYGFDSLPSTKDDIKKGFVSYYDGNGNYFEKKVLLNQQGSDKKNMYKKNLSFKFCEDNWKGYETFDLTIGDWISQNEFFLKAYYNDGLRGTAVVAYKLYNDIRSDSTETVTAGDAFPCVVYINGKYLGLYCWTLKKHRKIFDLDKDDSNSVWLDGTLSNKTFFQGSINWSKFEIKNPKTLFNLDGSDYNGDNPKEIMGYDSQMFTSKNKQIRCAEAKNNIIEFSRYCQELKIIEDSVGYDNDIMRSEIQKKYDVPCLIDYLIFSLVVNNYCDFYKNWQWVTTDGNKWGVIPYDCDFTFGYNDKNESQWSADKSSNTSDYKMQNLFEEGPMYWIKKYYWDDICSKYKHLRETNIISAENILSKIINWKDRIGDFEYSKEFEMYPNSPFIINEGETVDRFVEWITTRLNLEDKFINNEHSDYCPIVNEKYSLDKYQIFTIRGYETQKFSKGVNIIHYNDGSSYKLFVK